MAFALPKTKDLEKKFKKLLVSKGSDKAKIEITPYRDWRVIVIVFFAGLVASAGFNAYMFIQINQDSFFTQTEKPALGSVLNRSGLAEINKRFTNSAEQFEKVSKDGVTVVDPSL